MYRDVACSALGSSGTDVLDYISTLSHSQQRPHMVILAQGFTNFLLRQCSHESGTCSFRPSLRCKDFEVIDLSVTSEEGGMAVSQCVRVALVVWRGTFTGERMRRLQRYLKHTCA